MNNGTDTKTGNGGGDGGDGGNGAPQTVGQRETQNAKRNLCFELEHFAAIVGEAARKLPKARCSEIHALREIIGDQWKSWPEIDDLLRTFAALAPD